jgi:uncharacterized membrane protein
VGEPKGVVTLPPDPAVGSAAGPTPGRLSGVDWLRGLVMVLMALDHARDYFADLRVDPVDIDSTTPALFFTRWVTHFCAPVFVLLAGAGAFLYGARGRRRGQLAWFLLTRGLWLLVLEATVVKFAWTMDLGLPVWFVQVIAAIGTGMLVLAACVWLPLPVIAAIGLLIVAGHNALDELRPSDFGRAAPLWTLLHEGSLGGGMVTLLPARAYLFVIYPLLPWTGVLLLGYAFGPLLRREAASRRRLLLFLGAAMTLAFVVVRVLGGHGNATPYAPQPTAVMSLLSFLNCQKYPPSLAYLLMTLGPALLLLAWADREPGRVGRALITFGRVPLFYYVAHLLLLHAGTRALHLLLYGEDVSPMADLFSGGLPDSYGHPLWWAWVAWVVCVLALYPACAWYARVKQRGRSPLWSYL